MPLDLSSVAIEEKNKLGTDSVFLIALEITIPGTTTVIRVVRNTEDIIWNGYTWTALPFELDTIRSSSAGEVSRVDLKVDNTSRAIEYYIHSYESWCKINYREPILCNIYVINSLTADRLVTVNGNFTAGVSSPYNWDGVDLAESDADGWVGAGIDGSMCVRVVRAIGSGATEMSWRPSAVVTFTPPYPIGFRTSYWSKGEAILADGGGTQASRMTASIVFEDDSTTSAPDSDGAVPTGETDWYLREYTYTSPTYGIKSIRPFFYTRYQSGTLYLDSVSTHVFWNTSAEAEYSFQLLQPKTNPTWATFTLGANNPFNSRYPSTRMVPICRWKFKGADCQYAGTETTCDKTFTRCKALENTMRYRGFFVLGKPAI